MLGRAGPQSMVSPQDLSREEDRHTGGDERQAFSPPPPEPFLCVQYHVAFFRFSPYLTRGDKQ